jgi:hypothetical protein
MVEQICPGASAQPCIGKHFERPPLFCAKVNPRQTNASQRQNFPADRICHLTMYANRGCCRPRVALRSDLAPEQRAEALRIGRIGFASAGSKRKPKEAIAA